MRRRVDKVLSILPAIIIYRSKEGRRIEEKKNGRIVDSWKGGDEKLIVDAGRVFLAGEESRRALQHQASNNREELRSRWRASERW